MLQAGVILSDYATLMVEILKDNARGEAGRVYGAIDMPRPGEARRADRAGLRQVAGTAAEVWSWQMRPADVQHRTKDKE